MEIILKPIITEKMSTMTEKYPNRVAFLVNRHANKIEIKKAVESLYNVTVEKVNTMNYKGKNVTRYTKAGFIKGKAPAYKKAIIMLASGETIDFFSNI